MKWLVQIEGSSSIDTKVQNLKSKVELEVQHEWVLREDGKNESLANNNSSGESHFKTELDTGEMSDDSTFLLDN